jgi:hypothetical protein
MRCHVEFSGRVMVCEKRVLRMDKGCWRFPIKGGEQSLDS